MQYNPVQIKADARHPQADSLSMLSRWQLTFRALVYSCCETFVFEDSMKNVDYVLILNGWKLAFQRAGTTSCDEHENL